MILNIFETIIPYVENNLRRNKYKNDTCQPLKMHR